MSLTEDEIARAVEHALRLDAGEDRAESRRRAAVNPDFRAEVADWEEALAALWREVPAVRPPARVRRRLRARLFGRPARPWQRALPWMLSGAAAAALALVLLSPPAGRVPADAPAVIAEIATPGDAVRVLAAYDPAAGAFRVRRVAGAPPPGRDHELWAIPPGGDPVSLGVLNADGVAPLPDALRGIVADLSLAVSEEDAGGSRTGVPGTVLAAAPVTAL